MIAIKQLAKAYPETAIAKIAVCMPPLIAAARDINIRTKSIAERAMRYLLQGATNPGPINDYVAIAERDAGLFVKDYARRILSKLPEDSDDEGTDGFVEIW